MTNTSERTRKAALDFLEKVAFHFMKNGEMPDDVCIAGYELIEAVHADEAEAAKMRETVARMVDELEGDEPTQLQVDFDLEDTHKPMRFNLKKRPIAELDS
jgi:hypothetical protein